MNKTLEASARNYLRTELSRLAASQQMIFKLMYGRLNEKRPYEAAKALSIETVVAEVPVDKLNWAMIQVENSVKKMELAGNVLQEQGTKPMTKNRAIEMLTRTLNQAHVRHAAQEAFGWSDAEIYEAIRIVKSLQD